MHRTEGKQGLLQEKWVLWAQIFALVGSFVVAYFPVWRDLVLSWSRSEDYSHGFLIVPLSLYIVWRKREKFSEYVLKPNRWGLGLAVSALAIYIFAEAAEITTLASLTLIPLIFGVIIYLCGADAARELRFPILLLLFMIPVPAQIYSSVTIPLQLLVSKASVWLAANVGIPVYREGNVIHIPGHTLEVVKACSGLRSMVSLLTISVVLGYMTLRSNGLRGILFLSAVPVAVLVNIVRVLVLIGMFEYIGKDLTEGTAHTMFGIGIFGLALGMIVGVRGVISFWDRAES
jgi:exosortase